jgi:pilus assembly protein Flp/PilA
MKFTIPHKTPRRGAALIEYSLLIAGVALISAAAVAVFGHKTNDLVAATAAILPGAHEDDNAPIFSGKIIETTAGAAGDPIELDVVTIEANSGTSRLGNNLLGAGGGASIETLVVE